MVFFMDLMRDRELFVQWLELLLESYIVMQLKQRSFSVL